MEQTPRGVSHQCLQEGMRGLVDEGTILSIEGGGMKMAASTRMLRLPTAPAFCTSIDPFRQICEASNHTFDVGVPDGNSNACERQPAQG